MRLALVAIVAWFLWLPLADILAYPDRVSVLPNLQADAAVYHETAREIAAAGSLDVIPVRHPPGWVAMLGLVYAAAGPSYVAGKLISWIGLIVCVVLCALLARRMYGTHAAWIAAVLCASSPGLRGYTGTLQYEVITGTLLLVVLALAGRAADATSPRQLFWRAAAAGVAGAVLVLTREPYAAVVTFAALWIADRRAPALGVRAAATAAVVLLLVAATPAIAWSIERSMKEGRLITISEQGPIVMEVGFNTRANGTYNTPLVGIGQPTGLAFIRAFPGRTLELSMRKALYFWGVLRDGWNVPRPVAVWIWRATTGLLPLPAIEPIVRGGWLLAAFLVSLWALGADRRRRWWLFPVTVCTIFAVHVITLGSYRFSISILPVVYILVSGPLATLAFGLARVLRAPAVAAACTVVLAIAIAMQFQAWPLELDYDAVDLDGVSADNGIDPISGAPARLADAGRGERPIVILPDQYLPRGAVALTVRARRGTQATDRTPVMGIALLHLDGRPACVTTVAAADLPADRLGDVEVPCRLTTDGPATLVVQSLGVTDLAVEHVRFRWTGGP